jgi:hypothetical protein
MADALQPVFALGFIHIEARERETRGVDPSATPSSGTISNPQPGFSPSEARLAGRQIGRANIVRGEVLPIDVGTALQLRDHLRDAVLVFALDAPMK